MSFLAGLALACGGGAEQGTEAEAASESEAATQGAQLASNGTSETPDPSLLAPGTMWVRASERGFTLVANRIQPLRALPQLEQVAGVHIELGRASGLRRPVTLRLVDVDLEQVLAALLPGTDFSLHFAVDPESRRTLLAGVTIGEPEGAAVTASAKARDEREAGGRTVDLPPLTPEEAERRREERLAKLDDPDPEVRASEAAWIEPAGEGLEQLERIISDDPDAEVRIAATQALAEGGSIGAVGALLQALSDPDPGVVIAALDALEFAADETVIPRLQPLLEHPAVEVREKTVEAIDFLAP